MSAPHMRHLPPLMAEIIAVDDQIDALRRYPRTWDESVLLRDLLARRRKLTASADTIYGRTPARGDRGPSSAGAMAA